MTEINKELDEIVRFLLGEEPYQGYWFGDYPDKDNPAKKYKLKYWWRGNLRNEWELMNKANAEAAQPVDTGEVRKAEGMHDLATIVGIRAIKTIESAGYKITRAL